MGDGHGLELGGGEELMHSETALTHPLKQALQSAMPQSQVFKLSDRTTVGIPDLSVNWGGTIWLEVKATESERLEYHRNWIKQLRSCRRLELVANNCYFVVYQEVHGRCSVSLVKPSQIGEDLSIGHRAAMFVDKPFNHAAVATFVKQELLDRWTSLFAAQSSPRS